MGRLLEVKNLTKIYDEGATESRVVDNVSLQVDEGEFVMVMGASGSGKTSLLHLIAGIDDMDGGSIRYKNVDFGHMGEKAKAMFRRTNLGIVFQQQCLVPDLTVYENIMLPVMLRKKKVDASFWDTACKLCRYFGLEGHGKKYPAQLSGGQQQRAAILRAVMNRPSLLLCDEPTGSLNSAQSDMVMELLGRLHKAGQTIILVTHDVRVAARGTRLVYIADGSVAGELRFAGAAGEKSGQDVWADRQGCKETPENKQGCSSASGYRRREEELLVFLKERGW